MHATASTNSPLAVSQFISNFDLILSYRSFCFAVPAEERERFGLSDVIKFKLNTSGITADDVISARLGVYVRKLASTYSPHQRRRGPSQQPRNRGLTGLNRGLPGLVRVQVSDVTWLHQIHLLRRRTVYNVDFEGKWLMFEARRR